MYTYINIIYFVALDEYGWRREQGRLEIVWEVKENIQKSQERINYVLKGCGCRTGCKTKRCNCKKNSSKCGPGCRCVNCSNLCSQTFASSEEIVEIEEDNDNVLHFLDEYDIDVEDSEAGSLSVASETDDQEAKSMMFELSEDEEPPEDI